MESQKSNPETGNGQNGTKGKENGSANISYIESNQLQKIPYPKRVFFIIATEFCERFNYFGMSTILTLYLKYKLDYTEDAATVLFHGFTMVLYFMCLFGGIVSDVWWGKFKTISYLSIVYAIGCAVVAIGAIPNAPSPNTILIVGLALIAIGSGGIKPSVCAFGGDQFKLPEQREQMETYFSLFYFVICLGPLLASSIISIFREDVQCFGDTDCFSLAFLVPALFMFTSVAFFLIARSSYTHMETLAENVFVLVAKCILNAISTKNREKLKSPDKKLLDYSIDKYGEELVSDTRALLRILVLYMPTPFFWALYEQKASRWTFQAEKMNGDIGFYAIKPDQMQTLNPLLVLIFIPLFEAVVYPILKKIGIRRPLQKIVIGGFMAVVAFLLSALLQFKIDSSPEKSLSMLWQVPQYVVLSVGEVMFSIPGLAFSYDQAPQSMKSIVMSYWFLTIAVGDFILLSIAESAFFESRTHEILLFSGLMFVDMLIFMVLAYRFKSRTKSQPNMKEELN